MRVAGEVGHAGQSGDLGGLTKGAVLVQGGVPDQLGQGPDRAADGLGDRVSDREEGVDSACSQVSDVAEEGLCGSGAVGADEDVGAVPVGVGDLSESVVQHRDVIRGRVGSGVPGPEAPGHALAGVGQETQQGWKPKPPLQVGAAWSFSEWQVIGVASISRTSPGISRPPAVAAGMPQRVSDACGQATSRA